jgi:hypothetical protein
MVEVLNVETPSEGSGRKLTEFVAAVVLGAAALLTAMSAYFSSQKDGDATTAYTTSSQLLNDANFFFSQGNNDFTYDQQLFLQYVLSISEENTAAAEYIRTTLMNENLVAAVEWWEDDEDAETPFDEHDANPYVSDNLATALELQEQSEAAFEEGATADEKGDRFELAAILLAVTLFFGGIATLFRPAHLTVALLVVGGISLIAGTAVFIDAV